MLINTLKLGLTNDRYRYEISYVAYEKTKWYKHLRKFDRY